MKKLIVIPLIFVILLLNSCGGLSGLSFETISKQIGMIDNLGPTPRIEVVTQIPSSIQGVISSDLSTIQNLDYSKYVVFVVFFSQSSSTVTGISQLKAFTGHITIWVETDITDSASDTAIPGYQIVTVTRDQIPNRKSVLVRLLNESLGGKSSVSFSN